MDTIYVTDDESEAVGREEKSGENELILTSSVGGFARFMSLLQNTVSFVNKSRRPSLVPGGGEESPEIRLANWGYLWLYLKTLSYCRRWRDKTGRIRNSCLCQHDFVSSSGKLEQKMAPEIKDCRKETNSLREDLKDSPHETEEVKFV